MPTVTKTMIHKRLAIGGTVLLLLLFGILIASSVRPAAAAGGNEIPLTTGWFDERSTFYYSFDNPIPSPNGGETVTPAPIYVLFYDDDTMVPGQHNIVDVVPGEPGYSDLWQVHKVTVPDDYTPDSIRSFSALQAAGYPIQAQDLYVNCPIVPAGTTLQYSQQGLVQGWDDDNAIYYFDFGLNPVETAPIYVLFYDDDTMVEGQHNIIDTIPGEPDYSAFWQVHIVTVPDDYVPGSARSFEELQAAGYPITATDMLVNCPVVRTEGEPVTFELTDGWYAEGPVSYYSFTNPIPSPDGGETVTPAPIYVFFYDDDNTMVPGQRNIIDVVPGDEGYSDLWQVHKVTVPDDYEANTVRSYAQIVDAGFPVAPMDVFVNCPVVPAGSTLELGQPGLTEGWYQGQPVYYFDFGMNPVDTAPIYALFYDDGSMVEGQLNIVDTVPGEPDYSAFWQVHMVTVPDDYVPNSAQSLADLLAAGYQISETDMLVNCPIVETIPTAVTLSGLETSSMATPFLMGGAVLVLLVGAGLLVRVRRRARLVQ